MTSLTIGIACQASPSKTPPSHKTVQSTVSKTIINVEDKKVSFDVSLALTPAERQKGLMFRESLKENEGMLFVFTQTESHSFWMKNTYIPLDMIFIDENNVIVGIIENAEPMTLKSRHVSQKSRFVLEVLAGNCRRHSIQKGQRVQFENINLSAAR